MHVVVFPFILPFRDSNTMHHWNKGKLLATAAQYGLTVDEKATKAVIIQTIEAYHAEKRRVAEARAAQRRQLQEQREQEELDAHRQTRSHAPRRQTVTVEEGLKMLEYPMENLDAYGGPENIFRAIPTEAGITANDLAGFPTQIREFLWVHEGENDSEPWLAVGILENGTYFFYKGECDYTGFDCQGDMQLYGATSLKTLIDEAMGIREYDLWMEETTPE